MKKALSTLAALATILSLAATIYFGMGPSPKGFRKVRVEAPPGVSLEDLEFFDPDGTVWKVGDDGLLEVPSALHGCRLTPKDESTGAVYEEVALNLGDETRLPVLQVR